MEMTFTKSVRYYSSFKTVRVRFAPSPTGNLHLGGLRTALYNYLFAQSHKGKFILRIEDTDQKRTLPGSIDKIEYDLTWAGIHSDEGPSSGGQYGSYIQSQRKELYLEAAEKLINKGAAYYCFCSEKRLDLLRKDAMRKNLIPKYDNRCRHLSAKEVLDKQSKGIDSCVRFKLSNSQTFNDIIYGQCLNQVEDNEGDPIILKQDGWPTYHLANVVDDCAMDISHVIRGVEWLQSTNKHLMIYSALGYNPPYYAHLPLLLNADGSKFSKRQSDLSIEALRDKGVLPNTLLNFLSHYSSGFHGNKDVRQVIKMTDLIDKFDLTKIGTNSTRLPLDRLGEFNSLEIESQINNPHKIDFLINEVQNLVQNTFSERKEELDLEYHHIKKILQWSAPRISYLNDLVQKDLTFLWIKPGKQSLNVEEIEILIDLKKELNNQEFYNKDHLNTFLKKFSNDKNVSVKNFMTLLRKIISGLQSGPGVAEMLILLGKSTSFERIERAICDSTFVNLK